MRFGGWSGEVTVNGVIVFFLISGNQTQECGSGSVWWHSELYKTGSAKAELEAQGKV